MVDDHNNILLVHFYWEGIDHAGGFWACPGGGIDAGESPEAALRRELAEELGLENADIEGPVWRLTRLFPMPDLDGQSWDGQTEVTYLVRAPHFEPRPRVDLLAENVHGICWFSPAEVTTGVVTFSPRDLRDQLATVLAEGVPNLPREIPALD